MLRSDHVPILAVLNSNHFKTNRPFRFENWWLREQEYHMVAQQVGSAQLLELLPRKLNSQPLIFGNGKKENQEFLISLLQLRPIFSSFNLTRPTNKTTLYKTTLPSSTMTSLPKMRFTTFRRLKRIGLPMATTILLSSTTP
jgi:hypothetical protein